MKKEDFVKLLCDVGGCAVSDAEDVADAILEKCVIIEKGPNRHQDADALHQVVEGAEFEASRDGEEWEAQALFRTLGKEWRYRIKPPAQVFEWIWEFEENGVPCRTIHLTEDEVFAKFGNKIMRKVPDSKQERVAA